MSSRSRDKQPKSAVELMAELQQDPDFVAREQEQEADRRRHIESYRMAARAVLADLAAVGFEVEAVGDLRRLGRPYREAVPVLVRWLPRLRDSNLKEDIVRTLSVPWAGEAVPMLIAEFKQAEDPDESGLRWAVGNALEVLASDEFADDMIELATNRDYGKAREMLVAGLGKLKDSRVTPILVSLLADVDVTGHAVMALGKLRAKGARSHIEPLLGHPKTWIRSEAKKALARIDKNG